MKRVSIADEQYEVRFSRYQNDAGVMETTCQIHHVFSNSMVGVASATVKLYYKDQDIKKRAYKHALTKALADSIFDKPQRAVIWGALEELHV